jgi:hypothetical protein
MKVRFIGTLRGVISRKRIFYWINLTNSSSDTDLASPKGHPRIIHTKAVILKVKQRLSREKARHES